MGEIDKDLLEVYVGWRQVGGESDFNSYAGFGESEKVTSEEILELKRAYEERE